MMDYSVFQLKSTCYEGIDQVIVEKFIQWVINLIHDTYLPEESSVIDCRYRAHVLYSTISKYNSQESYDEIIGPFLDLDDIGIQLNVYQPKVTQVRLDIKAEFLEGYNRLQDHSIQFKRSNL